MTTPNRPPPKKQLNNYWLFIITVLFFVAMIALAISPFFCVPLVLFAGILYIGWQLIIFTINTLGQIENAEHGLSADTITVLIQSISTKLANLPHSNQSLALWGVICFIVILLFAVPVALGF